MKKMLLSVMLLLASVNAAYCGYAEGEVIIELGPQAGYGAMSANPFGEGAVSELGGNFVRLKSETRDTEQLMRELANDPRVKGVQPNYIRHTSALPDDPRYGFLWALPEIGLPDVWDRIVGNGDVCVAVIDSGIDYTHEDLWDSMATDSYGRPGRSFTEDGIESDDPMDYFGHGTHVAGTIGATGNNGVGVTGVNWNVKLLAVRVLPNGTGYDSDIIRSIRYILSEKSKGLNVRVASMALGSWETPLPDNSPLAGALKSLSDAGIICVIAAGNEGQNISAPEGEYEGKLPYPASFKFDNTITVGSVGSYSVKSSFSNYGADWVHIAAPGGNGSTQIYSTLPTSGKGYGYMSGTSMASAHVSGVAALLCSAFPGETPARIRERILTGTSGGTGGTYWRYGALDAMGAYVQSGNTDPSGGTTAPSGNWGSGGSGGGGGGCDAGHGLFAVILVAAAALCFKSQSNRRGIS